MYAIAIHCTLFLTIVFPEFFVMAHLECYRETETAIFATRTNLPVSDFQTWQVCRRPIQSTQMIPATSRQTDPAYRVFHVLTSWSSCFLSPNMDNMILVIIHIPFCLYNYAYGLNLKAFKTHNEAWSRTKVVMTDKDMAERSVFSAAFPYAFLQL